MSGEALPITSERFSKALQDLSVSSLYMKVAELRNSISHLEKSNAELEEFVRQEQDKDCYEAILENRDVIKRFEERIVLIKKEVTEVRALPWQPDDGDKMVELGERPNGVQSSDGAQQNGTARTNGNSIVDEQRSGTSGESEANEEEGVFL